MPSSMRCLMRPSPHWAHPLAYSGICANQHVTSKTDSVFVVYLDGSSSLGVQQHLSAVVDAAVAM